MIYQCYEFLAREMEIANDINDNHSCNKRWEKLKKTLNIDRVCIMHINFMSRVSHDQSSAQK